MVRKHFQFSMRTVFLLVLLAGPVAGATAGTFGSPLRELLLVMIGTFAMSLIFSIICAFVAFVVISPLFVLERLLQRPEKVDGRDDGGERGV